MANAIAIVADTGFGKSTAIGNIPELGIKGLDPKKTFIINVKGKPLPFKGWKSVYIPVDISKGPPKEGNYFASTSAQDIARVIAYIGENRLDIEHIVVDDYQYVMAEEFMEKALKVGFDKYNKLAKNAYDVLNAGMKIVRDINFIVLTHSEVKDNNFETTYKMKTIGNMLDNKVTLEGLFTIVLYMKQDWDDKEKTVSKYFVTNYDGQYPAKSPVGMFEDIYILNDLDIVTSKVHEYNHGN